MRKDSKRVGAKRKSWGRKSIILLDVPRLRPLILLISVEPKKVLGW
jgi:hypothetical protein